MKLALYATLPLVLASVALATAQNTTAAQPKPPQSKPAAPRPRPPAAATGAPQTATVTVTDTAGAPIADVHVQLTGSLDRSGSTQSNGVVRFDSLRPGTYRLRFEKDGYVLFERELEVRVGQPAPHEADEGRLVPGPAADHEPHLAGPRSVPSQYCARVARGPHQVPRMRCEDAVEHLVDGSISVVQYLLGTHSSPAWAVGSILATGPRISSAFAAGPFPLHCRRLEDHDI